MYCPSCGGNVVHGLSFCNHCGAKLNGGKGDTAVKSSDVKPETLVWGMVAVLVFGFVAIVFLLMAMKMVGFEVAQIFAFTILSFLIMLLLEGVFIWKLLRRKRSEEATDRVSTKELDATQERALPEHMPSVTEHTTRAFDPLFSERKLK